MPVQGSHTPTTKPGYRAPWDGANRRAWPWETSSNFGPTFAPCSAPSLPVSIVVPPFLVAVRMLVLMSSNCQDQYLGKFKTIIASTPIYIAGMVILVATSAPVALRANAGMGGLITAMITIGLGTGGLKACIAPMCGEQIQGADTHIKVKKSGERVVVDPKLTSARIFMW